MLQGLFYWRFFMNESTSITFNSQQFQFFPAMPAPDLLTVNYYEAECLEMALSFLSEQVNKIVPDIDFIGLRLEHLQDLAYWFNSNIHKSYLRKDLDSHWTGWIHHAEQVKWLVLALEKGITEQTVMMMATDMANYEKDMWMMTAENAAEEAEALPKYPVWYRNHYAIYQRAASYKDKLLVKLRRIWQSF